MQERTARAVEGTQRADGGRGHAGDGLPLPEWEPFAGLVVGSFGQQAPLASLRSLHPSARALVIVLDFEALLIDGHRVVFEGSFENINEVQMVIRLSDDIGHRLYLQDLLNHLDSKWRASYIASVLRQILEFLHV